MVSGPGPTGKHLSGMVRGGGLHFIQIQVAFKAAQDFVVDFVFVAQVEKGGALEGTDVSGKRA